MRNILGIDPGNVQSAYVVCDLDEKSIIDKNILDNETFIKFDFLDINSIDIVCCEAIASYGLPVGETVFRTQWWIGRFYQMLKCIRPDLKVDYLPRTEIKMILCHQLKGVNDSVIRQRLIDLVGPIGNKKQPGPCFGLKADMWSALGVCTAWRIKNVKEDTEGK